MDWNGYMWVRDRETKGSNYYHWHHVEDTYSYLHHIVIDLYSELRLILTWQGWLWPLLNMGPLVPRPVRKEASDLTTRFSWLPFLWRLELSLLYIFLMLTHFLPANSCDSFLLSPLFTQVHILLMKSQTDGSVKSQYVTILQLCSSLLQSTTDILLIFSPKFHCYIILCFQETCFFTLHVVCWDSYLASNFACFLEIFRLNIQSYLVVMKLSERFVSFVLWPTR